MKKYFFGLIIFTIIISCERNESFNYFTKSFKEIIIPDTNINIFIGNLIEADSSLYLLYQDIESKTLYKYRIDDQVMSPLFKGSENRVFKDAYFYEISINSFDSILILSTDKNLITLVNDSGEIINEYNISPDYTIISKHDNPIEYINGYIHVCNTSKTIGVAEKENRIKYYKGINPELIIDISQKSLPMIVSQVGQFPDSYSETGNNYYDFFPTRCVNNKGQLLLSFNADHNIYVYESEEVVVKKLCKSKYIKSMNSIPEDRMFDMAYLKKFQFEEPKYERIYYDKYRDKYYRIVRHRSEFNNDPEVDCEKYTWSIIVLDADFNIIGEQKFKSCEYNYQVFFPAKEGIYLLKPNLDPQDKTIKLTLLEI